MKGLLVAIVGLVLMVAVIGKTTQLTSKASGVPANLVISHEGVLGKMPTIWRNLAQGGEESKPMLGNVKTEVQALKPEYIRIDHIYDFFEVVGRDGGRLSFNFASLDTAVNEILAVGAKPYLSLSYMPRAISRGDVVDEPKLYSEWREVVRTTIEHYSGKSQRNIDGVIYEVWNEPDLFGGFKINGGKNYLELYDGAARGAMEAKNVNNFEIGGPATTGFYKNWLIGLINYCDKQNLRLDFISWHRYSKDLEVYEKEAASARFEAEQIPAMVNLKFYVTEWGPNSENDPVYDGKASAIHFLGGIRTMMGRVNRAFAFEIKDGPGTQKNWGRWGLLTHEKFGTSEKKPRYYAIDLLNKLGPFRNSLSGEGTFVKGVASSDGKGNLKVLIVNYDKDNKHSEAVPISFTDIPAKNFSYKRQDFLGGVKVTNVTNTETSWSTTEYLTANSAVLLSLDFN